ncbi:MAG TPA: HD domain-containing protein [Bacillota bacterium]|nr:HD domain-containing protein [Bacillota bacterium]
MSLNRFRLARWLPLSVVEVLKSLMATGHQAYLVGGCVRDLIGGRRPLDWDVATAARPEQVALIFPHTLPTGTRYGTTTVVHGGRAIEVTTFRQEQGHSDLRHPDQVTFISDLKADLARRDFTVNAMALDLDGRLFDPFGGQGDLRNRTIRAVGSAGTRFEEDALRLVRGVRLAAELDFDLEAETFRAICCHAGLVELVARERIGPELERILLSAHPARGLMLLEQTGLLALILPEIQEGGDVVQGEHRADTVWEHTVRTVAGVLKDPVLRLAALLHDVGKPRTLTVGEDGRRRFPGHEILGAEMSETILLRLKFRRATVKRVLHLIRHHLELQQLHDRPAPGQARQPALSDAAVRRLLARVGPEAIRDLAELDRADRAASRIGRGFRPDRTVRLLARVRRIMAGKPALRPADLAIDGDDVQRLTGWPPGPAIGRVLHQLLDDAIEDPGLNHRIWLERRVVDLAAQQRAGEG